MKYFLLPSLFFLAPFITGLAQATTLAEHYQEIRKEAVTLSGSPMDMPQRAVFLDQIFRDSKGNHAFPVVALHGALWGHRFFEIMGPIGKEISVRYFYSKKLRAEKDTLLENFEISFEETNRMVFIDTYTNYYFTKAYGLKKGAEKFIAPELLNALNRVHEAVRSNVPFTPEERKEVFSTALYYEQELTVGARVKAAVDAFNCPVLKFLALRPWVHFEYFPEGKIFIFHDFSNQKERIKRATRAYDIAAQVGFDQVEETMAGYHVIPDEFFIDREQYAQNLKEEILSRDYFLPQSVL